MSDELEELKDINSKLDTLIRLTAIQALESKKKVEAVQILTDLGFTEGKIADLLNTTTGSVQRMRHYLREKSSKKTKKKEKIAPAIATNETKT
jgi:DNA-directed RNA polymerase specialized sigma24 family protein